MRIQVRKCPFTGKIFEEKDIGKYLWHLKTLRDQQREERLHERLRAEFMDWLREERSKILHTDEIIPWFLKNQRMLMDAANAMHLNSAYDKKHGRCFMPDDQYANLSFSHLRYQPFLPNTHECPDNGVTNWEGKDPGKPIGYPGWKGNITGTLVRNKKYEYSYPYSEALKIAGLKTGSGGGGNAKWNYEVYIFLDDWTGLKQEIIEMEQELMVKKLKGER